RSDGGRDRLPRRRPPLHAARSPASARERPGTFHAAVARHANEDEPPPRLIAGSTRAGAGRSTHSPCHGVVIGMACGARSQTCIYHPTTTGGLDDRGWGTMRARLRVAAVALALALIPGVVTGSASAAGRCGNHPWCKRSLSPTARAKLLLTAMSQGDKVGILTGQAGSDVDLPAISWTDGADGAGGLGSGTSGATAMPASIALASNFDRAMAHTYGDVVGQEVKHRGFDGDFGPTVNLI